MQGGVKESEARWSTFKIKEDSFQEGSQGSYFCAGILGTIVAIMRFGTAGWVEGRITVPTDNKPDTFPAL